MTIAIYAASVALALLCIGLFFVATRRLLVQQEYVVGTMLRRYDDRLGQFAQALNDGLARIQQQIAEGHERSERRIAGS